MKQKKQQEEKNNVAEGQLFVSPKQVAKLFGVSVNYAYALTYRNDVKFYKIGRLVRFRLDELIEWFERFKVSSNDELLGKQ